MDLPVDSTNIIVNEVPKVERIGVHSHIYGLGLDENLKPLQDNQGMVGQMRARKAAGLIVKMIKACNRRFYGRFYFLNLGRKNCWSSNSYYWSTRYRKDCFSHGYLKGHQHSNTLRFNDCQ